MSTITTATSATIASHLISVLFRRRATTGRLGLLPAASPQF